jgi:hypothetical protein
MIETLVVVFFGFPAVIASLLVSVIGVLKGKFWLVITSAVLFIPFSYYLNGSPDLRGFAIFLPLFQIGSALAVRAMKNLLAWILLLPAFLSALWVFAVALLYQVR